MPGTRLTPAAGLATAAVAGLMSAANWSLLNSPQPSNLVLRSGSGLAPPSWDNLAAADLPPIFNPFTVAGSPWLQAFEEVGENDFQVFAFGKDDDFFYSGDPFQLTWSGNNGWLQFNDGAGNPLTQYGIFVGDGSGLGNLTVDGSQITGTIAGSQISGTIANVAYLNASLPFTKAQTINEAANVTQLTVKGHSTQSAALLDAQNSTGSTHTKILASGWVQVLGGAVPVEVFNTTSNQAALGCLGDGRNGVFLGGQSTATNNFFLVNSGGGLQMQYNSSGANALFFQRDLSRWGGFETSYTIIVNAKTSTSTDQNAMVQVIDWSADTAHLTRKARVIKKIGDATAQREYMRAESTGTIPAIGFLGAIATSRETVTGSRGGNAALADLITKLATKGLIADGTTA
jgi:hypothetical protein